MRKFRTLKAFKKFLDDHGVDYSAWGTGPTKTVRELWEEHINGETLFVIERGTLVRHVRRVQILITFVDGAGTEWILVEERQVFANGSIREPTRRWSVSEKLLKGEKPIDGAKRGALSEIQVRLRKKALTPLGEKKDKRPKPTSSYPGLPTKYHSWRYAYALTRREYKPRYVEVQPNRKTIEFGWTLATQVQRAAR